MKTRWVDRNFRLGVPAELFPNIVERLRGTPARLEDKVRGLPASFLTQRDGDRWSMQEHIGHLLDLDELHDGRLDDYAFEARVLRAADMENRRTHEAQHNLRRLANLLTDFRRSRAQLVDRLDAWGEDRWAHSATHPRLKSEMRVVDMVWFIAEHDDHHLTAMTFLARRLRA